jgi:hypothetical protein
MKLSLKEIADLIGRLEQRDFDFSEWDDFVSIAHKDATTEKWAQIFRNLELEYSDLKNRKFLTETGWQELKKWQNILNVELDGSTQCI